MSTESRYRLRLESGDRRGETIAIPPAGLTVGRRAENDLVLADASVSGRHAEIRIEPSGPRLRDLGSTNGTRVAGEKIEDQVLAHGDRVRFGNAEAVLIDGEEEGVVELEVDDDLVVVADPATGAAGAPAAPMLATTAVTPLSATGAPGAPGASGAALAGEGVGAISAERVARGTRSSAVAGIAIVLALGAAGALAWMRFGRGSGSGGLALPVTAVPGDLLTGSYSFEAQGLDAEQGWTGTEGAPTAFYAAAGFALSGAAGYGAELDEGEWACSVSDAAVVRGRGGLLARARAELGGGVEAWLGVELSSSAGERAPFVAWIGPRRNGGDGGEIELDVPALAGYDRARVWLGARARGEAGRGAFDDVSLVSIDQAPAPAASFGEHRLYLLGRPAASAVLVHVDRVLFTGLGLGGGDETSPLPVDSIELTASATADGFLLAGGRAGRPSFAVDPDAARQGLATIGADGYQPRGAAFGPEPVASVLVGRGYSLVRIAWDPPVELNGRPGSDAYRLVGAGAGVSAIALKLAFQSERADAALLAENARVSARDGAPGRAIAQWGELLARFPFEESLVKEAESTRATLLQAGRDELREIQAEIERARFFALPGLFRQSAQGAAALSARYAGSDVEVEVSALLAGLGQEIDALESGTRGDASERLRSMLPALEKLGAGALAERVRAELASARGGG